MPIYAGKDLESIIMGMIDNPYWIPDIHALEFTNDLDQEDESTLIYTNFILKYVSQIKKKIPPPVRKVAGAGLDIFNSVFTNVDEYRKFRQLVDAKVHIKEKKAHIIFTAVMKDFDNAAKVLSLFTLTGVIPTATAIILTPVTTFMLAAGTWGAAGFSALRLYRAVKKSHDPSYWLDDTLNKISKIENRIQQFNEEKTQLINQQQHSDFDEDVNEIQKKINRVEKKLLSLEKEQLSLKRKAITIAQVKFSKPLSQTLKDKFMQLIPEKGLNENKQEIEKLLTTKPSAETRRLMNQLEKNQNEIITARAVTTASLLTMAVGMTLVAVSPFCLHAAPVVMGIGIAITGLGMAIQAGYSVSLRLANFIAKKQAFKNERNELINQYQRNKLFNNVELEKLSSAEERLKFKLSFEQNKASLEKNPLYATLNEEDLATKWYQSLANLNKYDRKQILEKAETKVINEKILCKAVGVGANIATLNQLSEKAKSQIIDRQCRLRLKSRVMSFFSHKESPTKNRHYKFRPKFV